jgi:L-seryl-tRNA(Ser) seleniumtransferase
VSAVQIERSFRRHNPPVLGRIQQDTFILDMRTVQDHELPEIVGAFQAMSEGAS